MKCENKLINQWCNDKNIKLVQRRSQTAGNAGTNKFDGEKLLMCAECRKSNTGQFKIVKSL